MVPHQSSDDVYCRTWNTLILIHYGRRTSLPGVAPWKSKVLWYVASLPGVECVMPSLNSRQVAESRSCKTPYSSVEEHSPCLWKVPGLIPSVVSFEIYVWNLSTATIYPPLLIISVKNHGMVPHQSSDVVYCRTWNILILIHYGRRTSLPSLAPW
jgi:hypothetical protein